MLWPPTPRWSRRSAGSTRASTLPPALLADHPAWGPLEGRILGLSYGTGEVYLVLRETSAPAGAVITQGGVELVHSHRPAQGRIHPVTGDLYVCDLRLVQRPHGPAARIRPDAEAFAETLNVPTTMPPRRVPSCPSSRPRRRRREGRGPLGAHRRELPARSDYGPPSSSRLPTPSSLAVERVELSRTAERCAWSSPTWSRMQLHVERDVEDAAGRELATRRTDHQRAATPR